MSDEIGKQAAREFEQERELFDRCIDLGQAEIDACLAEIDPALADRVRRLLEIHRTSSQPSTQSLRPRIENEIPDRIGPYRVLEKLATGGMGEVYAAEQLTPVRRKVAIKIIRAGMDSSEVIARFDSERQALAMMNHPNIARIIDAGESDSARPYFVMEYVPGVPLVDYCDKQGLDLDSRLEIFIKVCRAVQHAHQKGIIHRDLKPSNILVMEQDGEPVIKVIDFGIAKALNQQLTERTLHTRIGHIIGTPEYMSPEQAELSPLEVDTRSDVYSLGVIFFELLSGRVPFKFGKDSGLLEIRRTIQRDAVPPLGSWLCREPVAAEEVASRRQIRAPELCRRLKGELESIAYMALAKAPQSRYPTADALAEDVQRYLDCDPVVASSTQRFYQARKFLWRHRFGLAATVLAFVLVTSFAGLMANQAAAIRVERDRANQEARTSQQVADFLEEVFKQAGPFEAKGEELSAVGLLDEGVKRLPVSMPEPSIARIRLSRILGQVYSDLGRYEQANDLLLRALEDSKALLGDRHKESLVALSEYSRNRWMLGDLAAAEKGYQEVYEGYREMFGANSQHAARILANLGGIQISRRLYSRASETLEKARLAMVESFGADHVNTVLITANLATVMNSIGKTAEATRILEPAMPRLESELGKNHPHVLGIKSNLGKMYLSLDRIEEGISLLSETLAGQQKVIGPMHQDTLLTEAFLAEGHYRCGAKDTGLAEMQDVLRRLTDVFGPDARETLKLRVGLASIKSSDFPEESMRELRELEAHAVRVLGEQNEISTLAILQQALISEELADEPAVLEHISRYLEAGGAPEIIAGEQRLQNYASQLPGLTESD